MYKFLLFSLSFVLILGQFSSNAQVKVTKMTPEEFNKIKQSEGVYKEGENYNKKFDGHGTGLRPPTEKQWEKIKGQAALIREYDSNTQKSLPDKIDNSTLKWFPPIGNQDGEGSCVSWACGYYTKTFQEAHEHDWDLSSCEWTGGYTGNPETAYQDKIFSPDFIYHQVNDGEDNGSYYSDNINLLENIGCSSWETMPYDPADTTSWPSEEAWREAPLYRSETGYGWMWVDTDEGIQELKELLADTSLAIISIDAGQYGDMTSEDVWTTDNYGSPQRNHANTVVGYDDDFGPYQENGEQRYGAFKVANSWGKGSWENVSDGFLYISYECMKQHVNYIFLYTNRVNYTPEMIALFNMDHQNRGECEISLGLGNEDDPIISKKLNNEYHLNGGNHPFSSNKIALDITEFIPYMNNDSSNKFFLRVVDTASSATGSINNFSIESYSDYASRDTNFTYISGDPVVSTIQNDSVYAFITNGPRWSINSELNDTSFTTDQNCHDTLPDYRGDTIAINNCLKDVEVIQTPPPGTKIPVGNDTISMTICSGNDTIINTSFIVAVKESTPPFIWSAQEDTSLKTETGCSAVLPDFRDNIKATDNCDTLIDMVQKPEAGEEVSGSTNEITITLTDDSGNETKSTFNVAVDDTINPTITCVSDQSVTVDQEETGYEVSGTEFEPQSTNDNCNIETIKNDFNNASSLDGVEIPAGENYITWTVIDNSGNSSQCTSKITVNKATGINELSNEGIYLYPNPLQDKFHYECSDTEIEQIWISDLTGKTIIKEKDVSKKGTIDVSDLNEGMFIVHLKTNEGIFTTKILKQ